jgi:DNA recombination protein RmuC
MLWAYLFIGLLLGILLGAIGMHLWSRGKGDAALRTLLDEHASDKRDYERRLSEKDAELTARHERVSALSGSLGAEQEKVKGLEARLAEQVSAQEEARVRMEKDFTLIAERLIGDKGKLLNDQQQEKLGTLLKPLHDRIKEFEEQVRKTYQEEERERFALKKEIGKLVEQNQRLSVDADNLAKALKGDSKTQGDWGEMILERMLESSGLVEGTEYTLQTSTTMTDGSRLRPDAVINLPGDKHIVIDAKVSLTHYERYITSTDDVERDRLAKAHTDSVRAHMKGLSQKDYPSLYGISSPDFVLMFVPIESAFTLAQLTRREIVQEAIDQRIFIVTHSTLMASLKLFHSVWKNERIARNHLEIAARAGTLYDKFEGFTSDLIKVGKLINSTQEGYEEAMKKLTDGPGNLVRQVEMLKELGAKTNKTIHPKLLERSLEGTNSVEP